MKINVGDRIHYNNNRFDPKLVPDIRETTVKEVAVQETGYGSYTEYRGANGKWISELQVVT